MKRFQLTNKIIVSLCAVFLIGGILFWDDIAAQPQRVPVLNYHEVEDNAHNPLALSVKDFDEQMAYLHRNGYHAITPDELLSFVQHGTDLPDKPILITFDDGYRNVYTNAYPILMKYHYTAITFLITDEVGRNDWYLNWDQVKEMKDKGFVFGSHTLSHVVLTQLSPEDAIDQLKKSKEGIEWRLDAPAKYFAYPTGAYNSQVCQLVQAAGYQAAFSIDFGRVGLNSNIYTLKRIPIIKSRLTFYDFYLRLHCTSLMGNLKALKKHLWPAPAKQYSFACGGY